jgi:hypothetical protein
MKIKVQFEYEGELPKELWWVAYADWKDPLDPLDVTIETLNGKDVLVLTRMEPLTKNVDVMELKTNFTGMRVIPVPEENA